jgi:hypothetical protein
VIPWKGGLAFVELPTDDPLEGLEELTHVEGNTFRRGRAALMGQGRLVNGQAKSDLSEPSGGGSLHFLRGAELPIPLV